MNVVSFLLGADVKSNHLGCEEAEDGVLVGLLWGLGGWVDAVTSKSWCSPFRRWRGSISSAVVPLMSIWGMPLS